ncbi:MAG: nucleotidyltransferase substrate binding protein [Ignavibacteriae bacterium]|nr:nucleotidyltransferase substrate binding protein [Ignavibacteriota bacterium]
MNEIYNSLSNSIARLEEIIQSEFTIANRDSTIKRFEMTVELTWKSLQTYLREQGIVCRSPKDCLRQAFEIGIIEDDYRWFQMMEDRNLTVHA